MFSVSGHSKQLCDGMSRRELMQVGGISMFGGMTLPRLMSASEDRSAKTGGPAKSVIMFNLLGGPSQMDMFDLKSEAAVEVRGEFKPIDTSVPGLQICEHLPKLSRWMHRATLIRTFSHTFNSHDPVGSNNSADR